jgi:hypothetical protein
MWCQPSIFFSCRCSIASNNDGWNDEFTRTRKEVVFWPNTFPPEEIEKHNEKLQSGWPVSWSKFESRSTATAGPRRHDVCVSSVWRIFTNWFENHDAGGEADSHKGKPDHLVITCVETEQRIWCSQVDRPHNRFHRTSVYKDYMAIMKNYRHSCSYAAFVSTGSRTAVSPESKKAVEAHRIVRRRDSHIF